MPYAPHFKNKRNKGRDARNYGALPIVFIIADGKYKETAISG